MACYKARGFLQRAGLTVVGSCGENVRASRRQKMSVLPDAKQSCSAYPSRLVEVRTVVMTRTATGWLVLPPPAMEMAADRPPNDELPVALDDAVPGGTRVKLRLLHS
jgi:hypothetical protein